MKRRTFLQVTAGFVGSLLLPACEQHRPSPATIPAGPHRWAPEAREYVQVLQERQYRKLASELGLHGDPRAAFARLSTSPMPRSHVATKKLRRDFGAEQYLTQEQWAQFDHEVGETYERYASLEPPTAYEDANRYRSMAMTFDQVQSRAGAGAPRPLLATLASGNVNALLTQEPETGAPIVFFEHGLFRFFYDFALLAGWAIPPLSPQQLGDDEALARIPGRYTMPLEASQFFLGSLYAYAVGGTPNEASPIPRPTHNIFTSMVLLTYMEQFLMAHELSHLHLGHLSNLYRDKRGAWEQEFDADAAGMALVTGLKSGGRRSWALDVWACDLALTALHFLDLTLCVMAYGRRVAWVSETHPDVLTRRQRLRARAAVPTRDVPEVARAAAMGLWRMNDALFGRLWEIADPMLVILRDNRKALPSPLWRQRIATVFATS